VWCTLAAVLKTAKRYVKETITATRMLVANVTAKIDHRLRNFRNLSNRITQTIRPGQDFPCYRQSVPEQIACPVIGSNKRTGSG
jgi:hypothetical protein